MVLPAFLLAPRRGLLLAGLLLLAACAPLPAPPPEPTVDGSAVATEEDRRFVVDAGAACQYFVEAARLAGERAQNPAVKAYAALLLEQHMAALAALRGAAEAGNLPWTDGVPAERRVTLDSLAALAPDVFDRRFIDQVGVADQEAELVRVEAAGRTVQGAALREWAAHRVPVLQTLLGGARQLPLPVLAGT